MPLSTQRFVTHPLPINVLVALGYVALATLPALAFTHASPLWPSAALAAFAALVWGWKAMPGVFVGAYAANVLLFGWTPLGATWASIGNVLAPMLGRWGMERSHIAENRIWYEPRGVAYFLTWMGLANGLLSALFGATGLIFVEGASSVAFSLTLFRWVIADVCSVAMLVPASHLLWLRRRGQLPSQPPQDAREVWGVFLAGLTIGSFVFVAPGISPAVRVGLMGMLILPAIWAIFRLNLWVTALLLAFTIALGVGATIAGLGPYAHAPLYQSIVSVELRGITMACAVLLAGALQSRRLQTTADLRALNSTLERRAEERARALAHKERSFREMIQHLPTPAVVIDAAHSSVLYANAATCELFGCSEAALINLSTFERWVDPRAHDALMRDVIRNGAVRDRDMAIRQLAGHVIWVSTSAIQTQIDGQSAYLFTFKDITERRQREYDLQIQAGTDPLTGSPNRFALEQHLPKAIAHARRLSSALAVGVIDLDDFKLVNDAWGHDAGDRLLTALAMRLRSRLRASDMVARLGGDEFVVVIEDLDPLEAVERLTAALSRLHGAVESTFEVAPGVHAEIGMTMGIALFPKDGHEANDLLRQADMAMYQAKRRKHDRSGWWQLSSTNAPPPDAMGAFDAYGDEARALLSKTAGHFNAICAQFVEHFYADLESSPRPNSILGHLSAEEIAALKTRQAEHLRFLFAPDTKQDAIRQVAQRVGASHALVGVSVNAQLQSYALLRRLLIERLNHALLVAQDRYRLLLATESRLQEDLQTQVEAAQRTLETYTRMLAEPLPPPGSLWLDASSQALLGLGQAQGLQAALLMRLNAHGILTPEGSSGPRAKEVVSILTQPGLEAVVDPASPRGQGTCALAWRSVQIHSLPSVARSPHHQAWHQLSRDIGIRSTLSIPIRDGFGQAVAVLTLFGAYPSQFESTAMKQFAAGLQQQWEQICMRCATPPPVVSEDSARALRNLLFSSGLRMYMQPIIDLRSGKLVKAEALARMQQPDGQVIAPAMFLPLLGEADMNLLFRQGLQAALDHLAQWDAQGLSIEVAVNLPPRTMVHPDCPRWVTDALRQHAVAPHRLTLELLETQNIEASAQDEAVGRLVALGVKLSMDDLGSGYSSLQRLSALPFSTIKADQALLVRIRNNPIQTMSMIRTIIQMGHDLDRAVVVEGLEDEGMIEAARLLGARYGQGYGLARPMPADMLVGWWQRHGASMVTPLGHTDFRTFLGALAFQWMRAHSNERHCAGRLEACPLTRFIAEQGLQDSPLALCHGRVHNGDGQDAAERELIQLLVNAVCLDARNPVPHELTQGAYRVGT
ncbi:MAG: EAL domain-containing protein [Betaproteobacteria bacterium]|nr:EAL domain-containing protein [Betaproteobacteria bacterium]